MAGLCGRTFIACSAIFILQLKFSTSDLMSGKDDEQESDVDAGDSTTEPEDEWHMDFMPSGYLPDNVYRDLAWYGILQNYPLHHSSKFKVVAQLIWQHTLGRPHVILENPPQSFASPGTVSRQVIAEGAAKWSSNRRAVQEVLMENIKSGGNGLTVRTVVSSQNTTKVIIQNGNFFVCPPGSEPNVEEYRTKTAIHAANGDIYCVDTENTQVAAIRAPIDPCIEAETAALEYSFHDGWMFCLGNGDRENNYFANGTLDCGAKVPVTLEEFLSLCAIDNNIVIEFQYFGDEPRKDLLQNSSMCTTWDPCKISYLYRLEAPPPDLAPEFDTTTQNPCETTICPNCMEGYTEDVGVLIDLPEDEGIPDEGNEAPPEET